MKVEQFERLLLEKEPDIDKPKNELLMYDTCEDTFKSQSRFTLHKKNHKRGGPKRKGLLAQHTLKKRKKNIKVETIVDNLENSDKILIQAVNNVSMSE